MLDYIALKKTDNDCDMIDDEEIEMYMVNPKAPCFIKDAKKTYLYLILPVNFNAVR